MAENIPHKWAGSVRIMIVDDHAAIREGVSILLSGESDFEVCGDAGTVADALNMVREMFPSVALIDISIGDESGLELIRRIKELDENVRILAWSMYDDLLYAERALGAGAMGYINKREGTLELIAAIRTIIAGDIYLSKRMSNHMIHRSVGVRPATKKSPIETLSNRELEVYKMIGNGKTTAEISKLLYLSVKTVETHRQRIKGKLQLGNASQLVREAAQWVLENG